MDHLKKVLASPYWKQLKESQDSKELPECIVKLWLNISISKHGWKTTRLLSV